MTKHKVQNPPRGHGNLSGLTQLRVGHHISSDPRGPRATLHSVKLRPYVTDSPPGIRALSSLGRVAISTVPFACATPGSGHVSIKPVWFWDLVR
ncbi:hypothetical protein M0R45_031929 [Rubus argutus]|uniref:Uncharacterized protein n=1 Tax=Rubus argutus TaxID=59490 RepID=A0AAW1WG64_RUBAR